MDSYYLPTPPEEIRIHNQPNFDHPAAFDWPLLRAQLADLKEGREVEVPVYDFHHSKRTSDTLPVGPCRALLIEGIYALWDASFRAICDLRVYLHVDADIRFIRRLHRDVSERGRSLDSIIRRYYDAVRPMHREHLEPTQQYADLTVGEENDHAAQVLAARLREALTQHGPLSPSESV